MILAENNRKACVTLNADQQHLQDLCRHFSYPPEAEASLIRAWETLSRIPACRELLSQNRELLFSGGLRAPNSELQRLDLAAQKSNLHPFTVHLLFYLLCGPELKQLYLRRHLSADLWHNAMLDLKYKLLETHQVYGLWGVHCGGWFKPFFTLDRLALGRLQFEITDAITEDPHPALKLKAGDPVINVHIPSCGPLDYAQVLDAYGQAARFFRDRFSFPAIPFQCESWMLYPRVKNLYPEGNLRRFTDDYQVRLAGIDPRVDDRWRVFAVPDTTPVSDYPENTRLQRKLKQWLLEGNQMGIGVGYFRFRDGAVLPHDAEPLLGDDTAVIYLP